MIKILVLAPFKHIFRTKDIWLTAHESYHLDPLKDREEIKYFLSDSFPYKSCVYFDKAKLDKALLKEAQEEAGFTVFGYNPEPEEKAELERTFEEEHNTFITPIKEAVTNTFANQEEAYKFHFSPIGVEEQKEDEDYNSTPQLVSSTELPEAEAITPTVYVEEHTKEKRSEALHNLHWRKIKDIAEGYEIQYTDKEAVVKKILELEYS